MTKLTLIGAKGLELTREEIIDLKCKADAIVRKAQCREVNCDVIDELDDITKKLNDLDCLITNILEG